MAKKQTRRSISVSRVTYERLKSFCETNGISMSQFVESRVGDFLGGDAPEQVAALRALAAAAPGAVPTPVRPAAPVAANANGGAGMAPPRPVVGAQVPRQATPMTSAAARFAVEPPPPIIKPRTEVQPAKPPTPPTADQIFTF